jgi:hypothetical protein
VALFYATLKCLIGENIASGIGAILEALLAGEVGSKATLSVVNISTKNKKKNKR